MSYYQKDQLRQKTTMRLLFQRTTRGVVEIFCNPAKGAVLIAYLLVCNLLWYWVSCMITRNQSAILIEMYRDLYAFSLALLFAVSSIAVLAWLGTPAGAKSTRDALERIGFANAAWEAPILLSCSRDKEHPRAIKFVFDPLGLPLCAWEEHKPEIEAGLNISIVSVSLGKSKRRVEVLAVPAKGDLPTMIPWENRYLSPSPSILTLGKGYIGPVYVDLSKSAHILAGGATGSGKSTWIKALAFQAIKKGMEVFICDFKGGVDFPHPWSQHCTLCLNEEDLLDILQKLIRALNLRKQMFRDLGVVNIDEYNKKSLLPIQRTVLMSDEVAEMLEKGCADKARKEQLAQIESMLATIARQGRAFGIHLILATQRPDSRVLDGQIKNNCSIRVAGRCDNVLSQIILDNTDAAKLIPSNISGRFLMSDGTMFQGYWFDEEMFYTD